MSARGLPCCMTFSSCGDSCLVAVLGLLTEVASHCGEQAVGTQASSVAAMGSAVASHSSRAQAQ